MGFDCDNGSEFLNYHLIKYFTENGNKTKFTRSRPYKKNDNAHVEQKNWTQVRHLFGYDRLDNESLIDQMNSLYSNEMESEHISEEKKDALKKVYKELNPFKLKTDIEAKLKAIFKDVSVTSNVRHRI